MIEKKISECTKNFLSQQDEEIKKQLSWLLERNILVLHETPVKVDLVDGKLTFSKRIGLKVETEQYIESLERLVNKMSLVVEAARHINWLCTQTRMENLHEALKELDGEHV